MKKVLFVLALWFLATWAYKDQIKPFIMSEFNIGTKKPTLPDITDTVLRDTTTSPAGILLNSTNAVHGIDISHYQRNEANDLSKIKISEGLLFIICKATEGISMDSSFERNWADIANNKLVRGAYHFYHCDFGALQQAQFFYSTISAKGPLSDVYDLPPIIDFETSKTINNHCGSNTTDSIIVFLTEIERLTKRKPIIYINRTDANNYLNNSKFASYPLWIAAPINQLEYHDLPKAWQGKWSFWQKSWSYTIDGIKNDLDKFNGDLKLLKKFIKTSIIK